MTGSALHHVQPALPRGVGQDSRPQRMAHPGVLGRHLDGPEFLTPLALEERRQ